MPDSVVLFLLAVGCLACGWGGWEIWISSSGSVNSKRSLRTALLALIPFALGFAALLAAGLERSDLVLAAACAAFAAAGLFALLSAQDSIDGQAQLEEIGAEVSALRQKLEDAEVAILMAEDSTENAKTQFLSNMSHELRTPLAGVLGAVDLLAKADQKPSDQRRYLGIIETSTRSLLQLVDNVLEYTWAEEDSRSRMAHSHFELESTLEQSLSVVEPAAREKRLDLTLEVGADVPRQLAGDATRILRILFNLLDNAVKFTVDGSVKLQARLDDPPASMRYGTALQVWIRLEVIDTGIGIGEQTEVILFEPLAQRDGSLKRPYGGAGMGLAVSRRLAAAMGGRIEVNSRPGIGSTFSLVAPFEVVEATHQRSTAQRNTARRSPVTAQETEKITRQLLVVDDDPVSRIIAETQASSLGYEVDVVASGADAIEALRNENYAAVLMDCRMPGLDGYETTRQWRGQENKAREGNRSESSPRLPVIAVTAHAREGERERCLAAGMDEMLEKPVDTDLLARTLDRIVTN